MEKRSVSWAAKARAAVALAIFGTAAQSALAQDNVTIDAQKCQRLESPAERLECYERQVNAASAQKQAGTTASPAPQAAAPGAPAGPAAPAPAAVGAAAAAAATSTAPAATATAPAPAARATPSSTSPATTSASRATQKGSAEKSSGDGNAAQTEIVGKVAALSTTVPNAWLITLDNGQVWRQTYPEQYPLRPGQGVTLRPSKWGGAFRLTGDGMHGFIQVEKVR